MGGGGGGGGWGSGGSWIWPHESKLAKRGPKVDEVLCVALMVEMGPTWSQFSGGRLEVSHLCYEKLCITWYIWFLSPMPGTGNEYIVGSRVHAVGHYSPLHFLRYLLMKSN